jgi:hypothetical protein
MGLHPVAALLEFVALVDEQRDVAAVIDDELRALAAGMAERPSR